MLKGLNTTKAPGSLGQGYFAIAKDKLFFFN
jgi:hypothetical protein